MKRLNLWLLLSLLIGAFTFVACGDDESTEEIESERIVTITFSDDAATVKIPSSISREVTATVDGAYVTITNTNTSEETAFVLKGSSDNGGFTYNGSYKTTITLNGLSLTSQQGAAIDIQCGKRIDLILLEGTENTLTDYAEGTQKACLYCKGHMEVKGSGTLNVTGNLTHAIKTKEYTELKESAGTINIVSAVGDAMHVGQYYLQKGGTVNITSETMGDGIQVEYLTLDDDVTPDPDEEYNGQIMIAGGAVNITMSQQDCKGMKADGDIAISGGTLNITAAGKGSRGIQTDGNMTINEDDNTTVITIAATGARCTVDEDADDPHRCMGIKVDGDLTIDAGTITVTNTGSKSRGIRVGGSYYPNGGTISANVSQAE